MKAILLNADKFERVLKINNTNEVFPELIVPEYDSTVKWVAINDYDLKYFEITSTKKIRYKLRDFKEGIAVYQRFDARSYGV